MIEENELARHIRYRHHIERATWSSEDNLWTLDAVRTDTGDHRVQVPEANATRHRAGRGNKQPYDRSRIHLDRPVIKIASHDFH